VAIAAIAAWFLLPSQAATDNGDRSKI
jgi:hypothetical protein